MVSFDDVDTDEMRCPSNELSLGGLEYVCTRLLNLCLLILQSFSSQLSISCVKSKLRATYSHTS